MYTFIQLSRETLDGLLIESQVQPLPVGHHLGWAPECLSAYFHCPALRLSGLSCSTGVWKGGGKD